jgi:hypothetical protein
MIALYDNFFTTPFYTQWIADNPHTDKLSFRKFSDAKCACISFEKQNECADHISVQMRLYVQDYRRLRAQVVRANGDAQCMCHACSNPRFQKATESVESFVEFLLCPEVAYPHLSTEATSTLADKQQEALNNSTKFETPQKKAVKAKVKKAKGSFKPEQKRTFVTCQDREVGTFYSHPRRCYESTCQDCGPVVLDQNRCEYEWSNTNQIMWNKFEDTERSGDKKQKELIQITTTYQTFMTNMTEFLKTFLPHQWLKKWDKHNRLLQQHT